MEDPTMYIFINNDLKMGKGKIAAQVGHIVQAIVEEIIRDSYEVTPPPDYCFNYMRWKKKCTKIILRASEEELRNLIKIEESRSFYDNISDTDVLTVVGFFPSSKLEQNFTKFKLL